ncbi:MAG TPA: TAXI family TRAP transporter solute-binding subunit, partial [Clostridia bacterium]|nr:TAXI family TRAP transporter solute-binding subunit [Clostridia bacterium]
SSSAASASSGSEVTLSAPLDINWGTGTLGGTIQLMGTACASVLQDKVPNLTVTVQATGGSIENCRLLASGDLQIGHTTQMYDAYVGQGPFKDDGPNKKILSLMDIYNVESVAIVQAKSDIKSLEDLKGKTVVLGPTGSGIASMATAVMTAYGYDSTNCTMLNLANDQAVDALKDGTVDMIWGFCSAKNPASYLESLYSTVECRALAQDPEKIALACTNSKDFFLSSIAAGTLPFLTEDYSNLAAPAEQFASADLSEEAAYLFVKTICENVNSLISYYAPAACIDPYIALHGMPTEVPVHPGAARYYKEAGVWDDTYTIG